MFVRMSACSQDTRILRKINADARLRRKAQEDSDTGRDEMTWNYDTCHGGKMLERLEMRDVFCIAKRCSDKHFFIYMCLLLQT